MELKIHTKEKNVKVLGAGKRFVIWVQGCGRRCHGCMSPETQDIDGGISADVESLADEIISSGCDGITISGGEPFLQPEALCELIRLVRSHKNLGVIIYTGFLVEELRENPDTAELLSLCDLLIDGPYIDELNDGKNLRGSSNQRVIPLTDRYLEEAEDYGKYPPQIEIFFGENGMNVVGVPSREMLERIKNIEW
ncbi:MAG: radical SAM protein [Ruminococcus flavefaciens]|nr:radical SAM protein [Ruminococcus flavefaciens]MCM1228573.1 radical SAM protein [Ruminococcus flavefaciens]